MVHRPSDSRLLNSLLSNEKEYHKQLLVLLDNYSQQSLGAFAAYASASPAPVARAVIAVAGSLAGADDALRRYAVSIEGWQSQLRALKDLEEDVGSTIRDREIFVTRLIKLSKNQKPTRDSFIGTLGSSLGETSQTSLSSSTPAGASSSKLGTAQAELQACEVHLAAKEKELDELRVSAVRRGLEARCKAMVECGWNWGEMGKEGLRALEGIENSALNGLDVSPRKLPSDPDRPPGSDLSSIGPSQSASQIYPPLSSLPLPLPADQPTSTPPRVVSPAPLSLRPSSPPPPMPPSASFTLKIPPAHSISELALPSAIARPINEEPEDLEQGSSDEDSRPVEVVENARFTTAATSSNVARRLSIRPHSRENSVSVTTSSSTGTGTGSFSQPASSTLAPPHRSVSLTAPERERKSSGRFLSSIAGLFRGGNSGGTTHSARAEKWKMRTETNLRAVRRDKDSDSEKEGHADSPRSRIFSRRASNDTPRPQSPAATGQRLKKRPTRENGKEKDKDQGWISDGATIRGRGARKGAARKRSMSEMTRPVHRPAPTSGHLRSASAVSVNSSHVSFTTPTTTPSRTTPSAKPKTDLRVETPARSSSTNVSRQSSLRSSGSAPPPARKPFNANAAGLPSSQSTPGSGVVGRSSSLIVHGKNRPIMHASTPPPVRAGSSQMSLMAIVEGVTRDNRTAWDRANSGLPSVSAGGTSALSSLVTVRAPPPVTEYNLHGDGGRGIAFETVLAPGRVFASASASSFSSPSSRPPLPPPPPRPPPAASAPAPAPSTPQRSASLPPPPRMRIPSPLPGSAPKIPLRSALRNHHAPPSPIASPSPRPKPIVIPSAPPRVVVVSESRSGPKSAVPIRNGEKGREDEGSDSGSVASFRTVRETLDTPSPAPSPVPASAPVPVPAPASSSALAVPGQDESDVSTSTISASAGDGGGPTRRKSVRVSLQPTFSPSPPALDEDEEETWERSGRPKPLGAGSGAGTGTSRKDAVVAADDDGKDGVIVHEGRNGRGRDENGRERDFWADSSDEDEEYVKARRLLTRASRKRW